MVQRAVTYEQAPTPGADWYHMALGAASSSTAGGYYDYERTAMIRSNLLAFTYTHVDHFYETNISVSLISAAFNEGRSLANFIGHGDPQSWSWYNRLGSPRFGVGHVWTLTNTNRLPFVIIAGCDAGRYTLTNECLAESFLKVGTPEAPCGGIAVQAAFDAELAEPPCTGQAEMMDRLVDGTYQQVGLLCLSGIIKALDVHTEPSPPGTAGEENAEQRHLFGDGSLTLFTDSPAVMTVSHAGSLEFGATRCTVEVPGLPGALCALYDPAAAQLCGSAYTDTNGLAVIRIAPPAASPLTLTVTAFNRLPYIAALGLLPDASSSGWLLQVR
jgi:hypothetical protein